MTTFDDDERIALEGQRDFLLRSLDDLDTELVCKNVRKGSFTQPRWAMEEHMIEWLATAASGIAAPTAKLAAEVNAAWIGFALSVFEMPSSSRACAPSASCAMS